MEVSDNVLNFFFYNHEKLLDFQVIICNEIVINF